MMDQPHEIRYGGGKKAGWTWECSCGKSDDIPYADAFDRTYWAKAHLDEVRAALAVVREET